MILTYRTRKEAEIVSRNIDLFICTFCSFIAFLHMFVCSWGQVCTEVGSPKFHQCTQAGFMNFIVNMIDSALIINVSDDERIGPSHFFLFPRRISNTSSCIITMYFHIYGLVIDPHDDLLPVGLIASLVEHVAGIAEVRVQIHREKGLRISGLSRCYLSSAKNAIMKFIHYHFYY